MKRGEVPLLVAASAAVTAFPVEAARLDFLNKELNEEVKLDSELVEEEAVKVGVEAGTAIVVVGVVVVNVVV